MKQYLPIILTVLVVLSGCSSVQVTDFESCAAAGNPVMESYPRQCAHKGETFVEDIPEPVVEPDAVQEPEIEDEIIDEETVIEEPEPEEDKSLVAHYTFDDEEKAGKVGNALYLGGAEKVELDDLDSSLRVGTIAFWFNFESLLDKQTVMPIFYLGSDGSSDDMFIIEIGHSGGPGGEGSGTSPDPDNKKLYVTWIKDNREPFLCYDSNINLEESRWYHFALVVGEDGNTGYLDGVEMKNRDYNFGKASDRAFFADIPVKEKAFIGYGKSSSMISPEFVYYKGFVDDFRIYNRALGADEIRMLSTSA